MAIELGSSPQGPFCIWQGLDLPTWIRLLSRRPRLSLSCALRIGLITATSISNSGLGLIEKLLYSRRIKRLELPPPVFILGHWRSGTTLLHNLLSHDPQFNCPNLYQTLFPNHFLVTETAITRLTKSFLPKTRPMDNMAVAWDAPQEDDVALCNLTLISPYLMLAFQGQREEYASYFDFADLPKKELERWTSAFTTYLKKVYLRKPKTLLLKSPAHTYRIPVLRELFPGAKFVYIVRDPYAVYSSSMHFRRRMFEANNLAKPNFEGLEEDMMQTYENCIRVYEHDKQLLGPGELHEMRFEDLEQDPLGELQKTYQTLGLSGFETLEKELETEVQSMRAYRKNEFQMAEPQKRRIYERWKEFFELYDYPSRLEADSTTAPQQVAHPQVA